MRADLRRGENKRAVDIAHDVAGPSICFSASCTNTAESAPFHFGIARRKVGSDIAGRNRAQQRIGQGVQQDVAVRMAGETAGDAGMVTPPIFSGMPG